MLSTDQQKLYDAYYDSTHNNEHLDSRTELLVGLGAAMALGCYPCMNYYLGKARDTGVTKGEIAEVLAKVMAVSAGQRRLQAEEVLQRYDIDFEGFA